ncbi:hypothetical protein NQ176_g10946 [Zarea fungicola]|uniref:Uncharacterized protein n=1 Tax=Zarea fungicola TaxID=93591 RepID=A0ACC1MDI1_9HYPO|nr:hypothetical protein NQ176_g10946 [Lecanicillium fungicola]
MSLSQLSQLLPLPDEELQQVIDYAKTLSKPDAASHFSNLLGDSPLAVDFISSFNARRETSVATSAAISTTATASSSEIDAVPKTKRGPKKKKPAIHTPQARLVNSYVGPSATAARAHPRATMRQDQEHHPPPPQYQALLQPQHPPLHPPTTTSQSRRPRNSMPPPQAS